VNEEKVVMGLARLSSLVATRGGLFPDDVAIEQAMIEGPITVRPARTWTPSRNARGEWTSMPSS
jgi:hypothetical protein